jgi:hypothetical protein
VQEVIGKVSEGQIRDSLHLGKDLEQEYTQEEAHPTIGDQENVGESQDEKMREAEDWMKRKVVDLLVDER